MRFAPDRSGAVGLDARTRGKVTARTLTPLTPSPLHPLTHVQTRAVVEAKTAAVVTQPRTLSPSPFGYLVASQTSTRNGPSKIPGRGRLGWPVKYTLYVSYP